MKPIPKITATVSATGDELEITDQDFIRQLLALGFRPGRNNKPEDLKRILPNIPPECREAFMAGFNAK